VLVVKLKHRLFQHKQQFKVWHRQQTLLGNNKQQHLQLKVFSNPRLFKFLQEVYSEIKPNLRLPKLQHKLVLEANRNQLALQQLSQVPVNKNQHAQLIHLVNNRQQHPHLRVFFNSRLNQHLLLEVYSEINQNPNLLQLKQLKRSKNKILNKNRQC
jgi:hypothetical protein